MHCLINERDNSKVIYLAACLLKEKEFVKNEYPEAYIEKKIDKKKYKGLYSIKK